jgi:hypothetical protein
MVASTPRADGRFDIVSSVAAIGSADFKTWANDWLARHSEKSPVACGLKGEIIYCEAVIRTAGIEISPANPDGGAVRDTQ